MEKTSTASDVVAIELAAQDGLHDPVDQERDQDRREGELHVAMRMMIVSTGLRHSPR